MMISLTGTPRAVDKAAHQIDALKGDRSASIEGPNADDVWTLEVIEDPELKDDERAALVAYVESVGGKVLK